MSRTVTLKLDAKVNGLQAGLRTASKATQDSAREFDKWAAKHQDSLETVGKGMTTFGVLAAGGATLAVAKFAKFDSAMSQVEAATHETTENMGLLRQAAIDAGADTAFSAEEAANGIEELAKAGVATADVMGGGLTGALDLAAAGNLGVGEAAEIAASAMTQFKLSGDEIPHLADLLAAGAGKAQGSVQDLGSALNQAGLVASSTGLSIEETTGGLAAFASAGLVGSDAGTSFKSMLQRLTPQSKAAQGQFDELGISAYDAQGNFVGLTDFAGQLQTKMADLTPEARNAAMSVMFGSDAVRASNVLYEQGAEGIQTWIDSVNDAGYAADTAALLTDNLTGDLERLGGSLDTVFIKSGSGANDALRGLIQGTEGFIDAVGNMPSSVLTIGATVTGLAGGAALLGGGLINVLPKVRDTREALQDLAPAGSRARKGIQGVGKAAGVAGVALGGMYLASKLAGTGLDDMASASELSNVLSDTGMSAEEATRQILEMTEVTGSSATSIRGIGDALSVMDLPGFAKGMDFVGSAFGIFDTEAELAEASVRNYDEALTTLVAGGNFEGAAHGFQIAMEQALAQGVAIEDVADKFPLYTSALQDQATALGVTVSEQELMTWALEGVAPAAVEAARGSGALDEKLKELGVSTEGVIEDMETYLDLLFQTGLLTMSSRDAQAAYESQLDSVDDAVKEIIDSGGKMGSTLNKNKADFNLSTEAGRLANAEFQDLARGGMDEVRAMSEEGVGQDQLQKKLNGTYDDLISAGQAFGMTAGDAENLAREVLGIPDDVSVDSWMSENARLEAEKTKAAADALDGTTAHVWITTHKNSIYSEQHVSNGRGGSGGQTLASGGRARLGSFSGGGRLPATGLGTDMILGVTSSGRPIANVDDREWVINRQSSDEYDRELQMINAGTFPKLPGYANGGQLMVPPSVEVQGKASSQDTIINLGGIVVNGAGDPERAARTVEDRITWKLAKVGMRIG